MAPAQLRPPIRLLAALVCSLAAVLSVACSTASSDGPTTTSSPSTSETSPSTSETTELPPAADPVRLIAAGDSVMYDLAPALQAALDPSSAEVIPMLVPTLFSTAARSSFEEALAAAPTDLAIVMVGVWESGYESTTGLSIRDPGWPEAYRAEVLDPVVDMIVGHGSRLLLLQIPPTHDDDANSLFEDLAQTWQELAVTRPADVSFVASGPWLDAGPEFREVVDTAEGGTVRLRRTDGVHLCAEGAIRLALGAIEQVALELGDRWEPVLGANWETGPWTERFPDDECPPAADGT